MMTLAPITRSEAEERLLVLIRASELPHPEVNVRVGYHEVDGFRFHSSRAAFERDRLRDAELAAMGFRVVRVTWRQLVNRPEAVMTRIATALRS